MSEDKYLLGLFGESDDPDVITAYQAYQRGLDFNNQINLDDTVKSNQNFVIGKQWEGVVANGLPTPVFNMLKRVKGFIVATITSDSIHVNVAALSNTPNTSALSDPVQVVSEELEALNELNDLPSLVREFASNAAVDGDGCIYSYWDDTVDCGGGVFGAIRDEIIDNTDVFFGNPASSNVQDQPFIQITKREPVRTVRIRAKANDSPDWRDIMPDTEGTEKIDAAKYVDNMVTSITTLYRNEETGEIWAFESTKDCIIKKPYNLGIRKYPIVWLSWDKIKHCYHGQAMITGLIPNQIFINKTWAMVMLSTTRLAFPKYLFDGTRIKQWDNRVGGAIKITGGDVASAATVLEGAHLDPQISQCIQLAMEQTEQSLGATAVALGDTRPDNTSAIIALQRAASTPSETTKQNIYKGVEELSKIHVEFMAEYYGKRTVDLPTPPDIAEAYMSVGQSAPPTIPVEFDFNLLKELPMKLKIDVGASSYFSEIAAIQTMSNLLMNGLIDITDFLERVPDTYVPGRRDLIATIKDRQQAMMQQQQAAAAASQDAGILPEQPDVQTGGGYGSIQHAINAGEDPAKFV